ncbi:Ig-like domain-containing protein [Escherichia coli]
MEHRPGQTLSAQQGTTSAQGEATVTLASTQAGQAVVTPLWTETNQRTVCHLHPYRPWCHHG